MDFRTKCMIDLAKRKLYFETEVYSFLIEKAGDKNYIEEYSVRKLMKDFECTIYRAHTALTTLENLGMIKREGAYSNKGHKIIILTEEEAE